MGAVVYLKGFSGEIKLFNLIIFNETEALKYYNAAGADSLKESPRLTIKDFLK